MPGLLYRWGDYNATRVQWLNSAQVAVLSTTVTQYAGEPAIVFEQFFYTNVSTGLTEGDQDSFASAFPSIAIPANSTNVGVMQWLGGFIDNGASGPAFGSFASAPFSSGVAGGPIAFFDGAGAQAAVLSTVSNFMSASIVHDKSDATLKVRRIVL